jgi:uncharacterized ParB-like nuclease family protein
VPETDQDQWESTTDHQPKVASPADLSVVKRAAMGPPEAPAATDGGWQNTEDHQPTPDVPKRKLGQVFWETIGGQALQDMIAGSGRDPARAKKGLETFKGLIQGFADEPARVWDQLSRSGKAMTEGNIPLAAHHLGGAVPFLGKTAQDVEEDVRNKDYEAAVERTAGMVAPFLAGKVPGAVERTAGAVNRAIVPIKVGLKAAGPDLATGAALATAGGAIGEIPGVSMPARLALEYPGARQMAIGVKKGFEAARAARTAGATAATAAEATPGELLARAEGHDWAKLSAEDKGMLENVARARQNAAAPPRPPMGPPEAPPTAETPTETARTATPEPPVPEEPTPNEPTLEEMQAAINARNAAPPAPATEPAKPAPAKRGAPQPKLPEGYQRVPTPIGTTGTPTGALPQNIPVNGTATPGPTLADMVREKYAPAEERAPVATPLSRSGEAQDVLQRPAGTESPLQQPAAPTVPPVAQVPPPQAVVPPEAAQPGPTQPIAAPTAPVVPPTPPLPVEEPAPVATAADLAATPRPMTNAQAEAAMLASARRTPPPVEEPRSLTLSTGEQKSAGLRAQEIIENNAKLKAKRQAQALYDSGIEAADIRKIEPGRVSLEQIQNGAAPRWDNVIDDLVAKGKLPEGERPPSRSIPYLIAELKRLEKAGPPATAASAEAAGASGATEAPAPTPSPTGPMSKPGALAAAQALSEEMAKNKTPGAVSSPKPAEVAPEPVPEPTATPEPTSPMATKPEAAAIAQQLKDSMEAPETPAPAPKEPGDYPKISDANTGNFKPVSGLKVRPSTPNTASIEASIENPEVLPGIREVPLSELPAARGPYKATNHFYAADDAARVDRLADQIKESGEINPLIMAVDKDGPYILEGGHRLAALHKLGKETFPAKVVIDRDAIPEGTPSETTPSPAAKTETATAPRYGELPSETQSAIAKSVLKSHGIDGTPEEIATTVKDLAKVDEQSPKVPTRDVIAKVSGDETGVAPYDEHVAGKSAQESPSKLVESIRTADAALKKSGFTDDVSSRTLEMAVKHGLTDAEVPEVLKMAEAIRKLDDGNPHARQVAEALQYRNLDALRDLANGNEMHSWSKPGESSPIPDRTFKGEVIERGGAESPIAKRARAVLDSMEGDKSGPGAGESTVPERAVGATVPTAPAAETSASKVSGLSNDAMQKITMASDSDLPSVARELGVEVAGPSNNGRFLIKEPNGKAWLVDKPDPRYGHRAVVPSAWTEDNLKPFNPTEGGSAAGFTRKLEEPTVLIRSVIDPMLKSGELEDSGARTLEMAARRSVMSEREVTELLKRAKHGDDPITGKQVADAYQSLADEDPNFGKKAMEFGSNRIGWETEQFKNEVDASRKAKASASAPSIPPMSEGIWQMTKRQHAEAAAQKAVDAGFDPKAIKREIERRNSAGGNGTTDVKDAVAAAKRSYENNRAILEGGGDTHIPDYYHRGMVEIALRKGKPVSPEVLADYPDLKPTAAAAPLTRAALKKMTPSQAKTALGLPPTTTGPELMQAIKRVQ